MGWCTPGSPLHPHSLFITNVIYITFDIYRVGVMLDGWMHPLDDEVYEKISQPLLMINMETFQWQENVDQMQRLQGQGIDRPMITIR